MGKLQVFEVVFEGDNIDVFKPGDNVNGYLRIVLSEQKSDIRGIKLKFKGKSKTKWTEGSGDDERKYYWKEKYFSEEVIAFGKSSKASSSDKISLDAGEHRFPFQFQIPDRDLPPPYEGCYGYIRYTVSATIDRPWKFDHFTQRLFSVQSMKDLNKVDGVFNPQRDETEKTVCCFCCASGPISVEGSIDKFGYVPGERIYVTAKVGNQSSRTIDKVIIALYQHVTFRALRDGHGSLHTKERMEKTAELKLDGCEAYDSVEITQQPLLIPAIPCTGWEECNTISVCYALNIAAEISGTPLDAEIDLPVLIGTIPAFQGYPPAAGGAAYPPIPAGSAYPPPTEGAIPSAPPPTYENAVGGLHEVPGKGGHEYTFGKLMYAPQYPYYNWDTAGAYPPPQPPPPDQQAAPPQTNPYPPSEEKSPYPPPDQAAPYPAPDQAAPPPPYPASDQAVPMAPYPSPEQAALYPPQDQATPHPAPGEAAPYPP